MDKKQKFNYEMAVLGDGGVGKTKLLSHNRVRYFKTDYQSTIGVSHHIKIFLLNENVTLTLCLWELAAQDMFHTVRKMYFQNKQGAVIVYDVSRPETFEHVDAWMEETEELRKKPNFVTILIGNKIDLERKVSFEQGIAKAKEYGILFTETSAKTGDNVDKAFCVSGYSLIKNRLV